MAAALAGLLAVLLPADGGEQVQTAAFVTHVENALAAAGQDNLVEYARTVYPSGDAATSGASTVTWAHQDTLRIATFDAAGQRVSDESVTPLKDGVPHQVTVNYPDRTWSRGPLGERRKRQADLPGCDLPLPGPGMIVNSGGWPVLIRDALSCGLFRMDGRRPVDGIDAIKLDFPDGGTALWIDPATYLPVRMVLTYRGEQAQTDFRWLSPTSANLAQLTVPVPAGFRQVSPDSRAIHLST